MSGEERALPTAGSPGVMSRLLPADAGSYLGPRWVIVVVALYDLLWTVRSLIHMFAPDGGAQSIATIDTDVAGGDNIIAMFAQWGLVQLLLALVVRVVLWRYRGLVPAMLVVLLLEPLLRVGIGQLKPVMTVGTAPGAVADYVVIPVLLVTLIFSLTVAAPKPSAGGS